MMVSRIKHLVEGGHADTPVWVVARRALKPRLSEVGRRLRAARTQPDDVENVHQLRVATRRSAAALRVFRRFYSDGARKPLMRLLRHIRDESAGAREDDVHLELLRKIKAESPHDLAAGFDYLETEITRHRAASQERINTLGKSKNADALGQRRRRLLASLRDRPVGEPVETNGSASGCKPQAYNQRDLAVTELTPLIAGLREAVSSDLNDLDEVHRLRIAGKKLRYALELLGGALPETGADAAYEYLERLQEHLGQLNDFRELVHRIQRLCEAATACGENTDGVDEDQLHASLTKLEDRLRTLRDAHHGKLLEWMEQNPPDRMLDALASYLATDGASRNGSPAMAPTDSKRPTNGAAHRRIAAIDVGTNSIRLVVAETDPGRRFRVIEDEKETTRLGEGVYTTGLLQPPGVEATLAALERMRDLATAKNVEHIRAVGTSAVREAKNRAEFLELALRRTGLDIEVLDAEQEARLAFSSVANSFELDDRCVAVADIGGGSTELILSTGGVIDAIYPLPLGAVRLTELYGQSGKKAEYRYDEMVRAVGRVISEGLHGTRHRPYLIIGTGGTFTSLARVSTSLNPPAARPARFSFALGGCEFRRAEVSHLLEWLRAMPLDERRRVPGLSNSRAEIIVAGTSIIERLMQFFGVDRLRVHDGGIRDGLLSQMLDELGYHPKPPAARGADVIQEAHRLAEDCEYEAAHSEHVAFLSLRIFDQLADNGLDLAGLWSGLHNRTLLQAAGILHDVGLLIDRQRHHLHSYDIIMHARLPALSRREVEIIANICRYHRRGGPRRKDANFRRLGDDDQRLVAHLAGILRIADGLDRLHQHNVADVLVQAGDDEIAFRAVAEHEPVTELRYARKKADVFECAFHARVRIKWSEPRQSTEVETDVIGAGI